MASTFSHLFTFSFRLSTGQDATEAFEDVGHSDEARALLPGMYVGDFEQDAVSDHTVLLQLCAIAYLSPSEHQVNIRSCRCSGKQNVWCCRARLKVRLSFKLLSSPTRSSLNYQQFDVRPASGTTWWILCMAFLYHRLYLTALAGSSINYILLSYVVLVSVSLPQSSDISGAPFLPP